MCQTVYVSENGTVGSPPMICDDNDYDDPL